MRAGAGTRGIAAMVAALIALAMVTVGCGDGETVRYRDRQIIKKLNLEKSENGYSIDGDIFCEVERKLLNTAEEVSSAADGDDLGLVITSREGNVGVKGIPAFPRDCGDKARKQLSKLDPKPRNDD